MTFLFSNEGDVAPQYVNLHVKMFLIDILFEVSPVLRKQKTKYGNSSAASGDGFVMTRLYLVTGSSSFVQTFR